MTNRKNQDVKNSNELDEFQEILPVRFLKPDEDLIQGEIVKFEFHSFTTITENTTGDTKDAVCLISEETGEMLTAGNKVLVNSISRANPLAGDIIGVQYEGLKKSTTNKGQSFHDFRVFIKRKE